MIGDVNEFDFFLQVGGGVSYKKIDLSVKYLHGLNNISDVPDYTYSAKTDRLFEDGAANAKNSALIVVLGFKMR